MSDPTEQETPSPESGTEGAAPQPAPQGEAAEPAPFDMAGRRNFGPLLGALAILVILGAGALVFFGRVGPLAGRMPEGVIASVGGTDVRLDTFRSWVTSLPSSVHLQLGNADFRRQLLDQYLDRVALLEYGQKQGVFETETFKKRYDEWRGKLAIEAMVQDVLKESMRPELLKSFYTEHRKNYPLDFDDPSQQYRLIEDYQRHMVMGLADSALKGKTIQRSTDVTGPVLAQIVLSGDESEPVTLEDWEMFVSQLSEQDQRYAVTPDGKEEILQRLLRAKALTAMARTRGYQKKQAVEERLSQIRPHIAAQVLAEDRLRNMDDLIIKELEEHQSDYEKPRMKLAHILVRLAPSAGPAEAQKAEARAKEIYQEITAKHGDYAEVAKRRSEDPDSAPKGGELGEVYPDQLTKPMAEAAFALKEGEVSEPVRTMFGFHILKALSTPEIRLDPESARLTARGNLLQKATEDLLKEIRTQLGVNVDEERFAAWAPPPSPDEAPTMDQLSQPVGEDEGESL